MGMTYGLFSATGEALVWILGAVALSSSFLVSYSEARYESAFDRKMPWSGARVAAKRDARLFAVMLGGLLNQVLLALLAISLWGTVEVVRRLWYGYRGSWGTPGSNATVAHRKGAKQTGRTWSV